MIKKHQCPLIVGLRKEGCEHGGSKAYSYRFMRGTAAYCRLVNRWICDIETCPLTEQEAHPTHKHALGGKR